jgi:uncharacterized membrane protein
MLVSLIVVLIVLGLVLWGVSQLPLDPTIVKLIYVVVIIFAVLYLLKAFGLLAGELPKL